jgi:hypothetical protein
VAFLEQGVEGGANGGSRPLCHPFLPREVIEQCVLAARNERVLRPADNRIGIVEQRLTHRGRDAIREWMADEAQQYGKTQVTAHAVGDFPGSPIDLRFFFVLANDKVAELEITV